jgi:hypothetical protein
MHAPIAGDVVVVATGVVRLDSPVPVVALAGIVVVALAGIVVAAL